jgi:hypothetical protein
MNRELFHLILRLALNRLTYDDHLIQPAFSLSESVMEVGGEGIYTKYEERLFVARLGSSSVDTLFLYMIVRVSRNPSPRIEMDKRKSSIASPCRLNSVVLSLDAL